MNFFQTAFGVLATSCIILTWRQYTAKSITSEQKEEADSAITPKAKAEASRFVYLFLLVYCLVMGSDWLQGPYVYSLYKDQFNLPEKIVALLFTTGFLSGGISGYFVGSFADKYGRRTACLLFCVTYSTACFSTLFPTLPILFLGRIFGGVSTSLMYSAFESWMVTEYHKKEIGEGGMSLSSLFGVMSSVNSVVAILAGVFSEWLVEKTGTRRAPFMASAALLSVAFWVIMGFWSENYGDSAPPEEAKNSDNDHSPTRSSPSTTSSTISYILNDRRILTLGLASCFFEGSMYLFVFFWTPALRSTLSSSTPLPLGLIFASFMASTMLGSLMFNLLISSSIITHTKLLTIIFSISSLSLLLPLLFPTSTPITFWSFCVFEVCVGMYWPSVGYLKGRIVDDGRRARVYGCLRIPLNAFVVVALGSVREGEAYRRGVFTLCGALLVGTSVVFRWFVKE